MRVKEQMITTDNTDRTDDLDQRSGSFLAKLVSGAAFARTILSVPSVKSVVPTVRFRMKRHAHAGCPHSRGGAQVRRGLRRAGGGALSTTLRGVVLAGVMASALPAWAELTVYYVRHGQGGHNVESEWAQTRVPKSEWPAWVGSQNHFTPLGAYQVQALGTNLLPYTFDFIAVSPLWRTQHTILPYLKLTGRTAEIWPELVETSFHGNPVAAADGQSVFAGGKPIEIPAAEQAFFRLRDDPAGRNWMTPTNPAMAGALTVRVQELLRSRFGTNDTRVLLVGHGTAGLGLVRYMTRNPKAADRHMDNTRLWCLDEQADGTFKLLYHNQRAEKVR